MNSYNNSAPQVIDLTSDTSSAVSVVSGSVFLSSLRGSVQLGNGPLRATRGGGMTGFLSLPGSVSDAMSLVQDSEVSDTQTNVDEESSGEEVNQEPTTTVPQVPRRVQREIPVPFAVEELPDVIPWAREPISKPPPYEELVSELQNETVMAE